MTAIQQAIQALERKHGTLRAAARAVKLDVAYMHRLKTGEKENPGDQILRKLGLVKSVTYESRK